MDTVIARAIAWQVRKRSVPAALRITTLEQPKTFQLPGAVFGEEFQTLNRKSAGIHKSNRFQKKSTRVPWEI